MANFVCPYQYRLSLHRFIMCKKKIADFEKMSDKKEALKAYCPFQKHCSCTGGAENTEQAMECYQQKKNQTANAD